MPPPVKYPVRISPEYLRELRARVETVGVGAVVRAAGMARTTMWRALAPKSGRNPTPDAVERVRRAVAKLDPQGAPLPPPLVAVKGRGHHAWIQLAEKASADDLERVADDPAHAATVLAALKRRSR